MTAREIEIATAMLDDLKRGASIGIKGMDAAYWGAKATVEEMGVHVEVVGESHVLFCEVEER